MVNMYRDAKPTGVGAHHPLGTAPHPGPVAGDGGRELHIQSRGGWGIFFLKILRGSLYDTFFAQDLNFSFFFRRLRL